MEVALTLTTLPDLYSVSLIIVDSDHSVEMVAVFWVVVVVVVVIVAVKVFALVGEFGVITLIGVVTECVVMSSFVVDIQNLSAPVPTHFPL